MKEINLFEAKTHFSDVIKQVVQEQEEFTITRRGEKVAKLIPFKQQRTQAIETILREMRLLSEEIGQVGMTTKEIQRAKEKGRRS